MTAFVLIAAFTLVSAAVAMALRNLIRSALLLVGSWAGIAGFYLWAGAEFVAFAQVLVYIGAVSMVVLFAVLLTRHARGDLGFEKSSVARAVTGLIAGGAVFAVLIGAVLSTRLSVEPETPPHVPVKELGTLLAGPHAAALLVAGVLLTVALLGGLVLAATDRGPASSTPDRR